MAEKPKMQPDVKKSWQKEVTDSIYNTASDAYNAAKEKAAAVGSAVVDAGKKAWGSEADEKKVYQGGSGPRKYGSDKMKKKSDTGGF